MWLAMLTGISRAMKGPFLEFRDAVLKELTLLVRDDPGVRTLVRHGGLEVAAGVVGSIRKAGAPRGAVAAGDAVLGALIRRPGVASGNSCWGGNVEARIILHSTPTKR